MDKQEYIKILKENQNAIKKIISEYEEYSENYDLSLNENFLITKNQHLKIALFNLAFIVLTSTKKDIFDMFSTAALFIFIIEMYIIFSFDKYQKDLKSINESDLNFIKKNELESEKLENAIKFFYETPNNQIEKYLSYKMGDGKKIN